MFEFDGVQFEEVVSGVMRSTELIENKVAAKVALGFLQGNSPLNYYGYNFFPEGEDPDYCRLYVFNLKMVEVFGKQSSIGNNVVSAAREFPPEHQNWEKVVVGTYSGIWVRRWAKDNPVGHIYMSQHFILPIYRLQHGNSSSMVPLSALNLSIGLSEPTIIRRFAALSMKVVHAGELLTAFDQETEARGRNIEDLLGYSNNLGRMYIPAGLAKQIAELWIKRYRAVVLRAGKNSYSPDKGEEIAGLIPVDSTHWVSQVAVMYIPDDVVYGWEKYQPSQTK